MGYLKVLLSFWYYFVYYTQSFTSLLFCILLLLRAQLEKELEFLLSKHHIFTFSLKSYGLKSLMVSYGIFKLQLKYITVSLRCPNSAWMTVPLGFNSTFKMFYSVITISCDDDWAVSQCSESICNSHILVAWLIGQPIFRPPPGFPEQWNVIPLELP